MQKKMENMSENVFNFFEQTGILKELVVIIGNLNKHFLSLWNHLNKNVVP